MVYESTGSEALDSPDNLCVTPRGGLILCEDDASSDSDLNPAAPDIEDVNRLVGFSRRGEVFEFAVNRLNDSEFAGATFSPDGEILFVNILGETTFVDEPNEGMTIAITGAWVRVRCDPHTASASVRHTTSPGCAWRGSSRSRGEKLSPATRRLGDEEACDRCPVGAAR